MQATTNHESAIQVNVLSVPGLLPLVLQWLGGRTRGEAPWCLTVSFVNPHDQQFFWAGTEFQTYDALFQGNPLQPFTLYSTPDNPPLVAWDADPLKDPPPLGYPALPPNWQSAA